MVIKQYDYDGFAKYYEALELGDSISYDKNNSFLDQLFKDFKVKKVLDLTCGTGAQSIYLASQGYEVLASDLSKEMLKYAKQKSKTLPKKSSIKFKQGDIRTAKYGKFDAAISMFNSIGHLSEKDFAKALRNVADNLKPKGLYVFDIFNFDFMKKYGRFKSRFIDRATNFDGKKYVRFNNNNLDKKNKVMNINQRVYIQEDFGKLDVFRESWDMKIYNPKDLKSLIDQNGFELYQLYGGPGQPFLGEESNSMWVVVIKK